VLLDINIILDFILMSNFQLFLYHSMYAQLYGSLILTIKQYKPNNIRNELINYVLYTFDYFVFMRTYIIYISICVIVKIVNFLYIYIREIAVYSRFVRY